MLELLQRLVATTLVHTALCTDLSTHNIRVGKIREKYHWTDGGQIQNLRHKKSLKIVDVLSDALKIVQ